MNAIKKFADLDAKDVWIQLVDIESQIYNLKFSKDMAIRAITFIKSDQK